MKTLTFKKLSETRIPFTGADEVALAIGPDKLPRVAVHIGKAVWYGRMKPDGSWYTAKVVEASMAGGSIAMPVLDCYGISITSSPVADVIGCRNRTKDGGSAMQKWHGPVIAVIPAGGIPNKPSFHGFTEGACRVIFDGPDDNTVEIWSKDGNWRKVDVRFGTVVAEGKDPLTGTGEKLCVAPGGWRGFSGYRTDHVDSKVMRRGAAPVSVMETDVYDCGSDTNWPGLGSMEKQGIPVAYYFLAIGGRMLVNKVGGSVALYPTSNLHFIGAATTLNRHSPCAVAVRGRMAAFWTAGAGIVGADVDGSLAGQPVTFIAAGQKAAAAKNGAGIDLAILRGGDVFYMKLATVKA